MSEEPTPAPSDFIRARIIEDNESGRFGGRVHTRWPPEPNGYLHLGHATAINLNFGIANDFSGLCNFRFDDTNPLAEEAEYVESQKEDTHWLGFDWGDRELYASDYFEQLYELAEQLVLAGKAYVDHLTGEEIREYRGTLTEPGRNSPYRDRSAEENLDLFRRMRAGELEDGTCVLRAKIDMASPNMNMRDPTIYRIRRASHHQTGDEWCIYPMYDYAHPISDSLEGITHSLCSMEYEDHRPLYDWFLDELNIYHPQQIEFARFNITHTVLSKRRLITLVEDKHVNGWDDPRMPTIAGLRRRGYTPQAIRAFCDEVGINRTVALTEMGLLEHHLRTDLNIRAQRRMAVLNPLKVVIENFRKGKSTTSTLSTTRKTSPQEHEKYRSPGSCSSTATTSWKTRRGDSTGSHQIVRSGSGTATSSSASKPSRTPPVRSWSCAAPTIQRRGAARPRTDVGCARRCTGCPPNTRSTPRYDCTTACSACQIRTTSQRARPGPTSSTQTL